MYEWVGWIGNLLYRMGKIIKIIQNHNSLLYIHLKCLKMVHCHGLFYPSDPIVRSFGATCRKYLQMEMKFLINYYFILYSRFVYIQYIVGPSVQKVLRIYLVCPSADEEAPSHKVQKVGPCGSSWRWQTIADSGFVEVANNCR